LIYLEHVENIADSEFQLLPLALPHIVIYPGPSTPLINSIAEQWECDAQCCLEMNLQYNTYKLFATREEYNFMQCGIKKKGMKTYYDNVLKEENIPVHFPIFKHMDAFQKLVTSMPDDQALGEWKLHTLEDVRWNENHQRPRNTGVETSSNA
jgi:hypothetical protein